MNTICPILCKKKMEEDSSMHIIDIRESFEYEFSNIGSQNIPMQKLLDTSNNLDASKTYILMCKTGKRAFALANLLELEKGMKNILVMEDGINGWKEKNDPSLIIE
ncbi:MAG: rhodanese-like domain-containing protein [Crocinitomicaceae bacterium]